MDIFIPKFLLLSLGTSVLIFLLAILVAVKFQLARRRMRHSPFTECFLRPPGHSVRQAHFELADRSMDYFLYFLFVSLTFFVIALFSQFSGKFFALSLLGLFLVYCLYKISYLFDRLQNYKLGCEGEEYTGQELNFLMLHGAYVFHDIPYPYGNIDHVIVGYNKVFVVETKAVRKPSKSASGEKKNSTVRVQGDSLNFPHFTTSTPITQAVRHAEFMDNWILNKLGFHFEVVPVVALPGWFVNGRKTEKTGVLIINPKRGKALIEKLGRSSTANERNLLIEHLESVARSISPGSKKTDPNANKHFDFWLNPKQNQTLLGD